MTSDETNKKIKINLTSKDGRNAEVEFSSENKSDALELLLKLGFGPESSNKQSLNLKSFTKEKTNSRLNKPTHNLEDRTKLEQIKILIKSLSQKPGHWFTSKDILDLYEQHVNEHISLSTVSTYLSRLETQHILQRRGSKKDLEYCLNIQELESIPLYDLVEKRFISIKEK